MRHPLRRTGVVAALLGVALTAPCVAWYLSGSHSAREDARRLLEAPRVEARETATQLALRVANRLEELRLDETRRPLEHYSQASAGDCGCAEPSDDQKAPEHPLVQAHFEIDDLGRVRVPDRDRIPTHDEEADRFTVREALECAVSDSLVQEANNADRTAASSRLGEEPLADRVMLVGPFRWRTVELDNAPGLVALREVWTAEAVLVQGFLVSLEAASTDLLGAAFPATILPDTGESTTVAQIPIEGARWFVATDPSRALALAREEADAVQRRFRNTFLAGVLAIAACGALLLGLVWQNDRLSRQRARFAAAAAHELRTPLAGMRLYGELLASGRGAPEKQRDYAQRISREAARLGRVVNNVMSYSRLERSPVKLHLEPGDLVEAVASALEPLRPTLESSGVVLETDLPGSLPAARIDTDAVFQIVQNLVDNAEKHTRDCEQRRIRVSVDQRDDGLTLEVRDHGPGIPRELRKDLFKAFHRGADDRVPGLGLGLMLVASLARGHGAMLDYADAPGGGTTFSVRFPLAA